MLNVLNDPWAIVLAVLFFGGSLFGIIAMVFEPEEEQEDNAMVYKGTEYRDTADLPLRRVRRKC